MDIKIYNPGLIVRKQCYGLCTMRICQRKEVMQDVEQ